MLGLLLWSFLISLIRVGADSLQPCVVNWGGQRSSSGWKQSRVDDEADKNEGCFVLPGDYLFFFSLPTLSFYFSSFLHLFSRMTIRKYESNALSKNSFSKAKNYYFAFFPSEELSESKMFNSVSGVLFLLPDCAKDAPNSLKSVWCLGTKCVGRHGGWSTRSGGSDSRFSVVFRNFFGYTLKISILCKEEKKVFSSFLAVLW